MPKFNGLNRLFSLSFLKKGLVAFFKRKKSNLIKLDRNNMNCMMKNMLQNYSICKEEKKRKKYLYLFREELQ